MFMCQYPNTGFSVIITLHIDTVTRLTRPVLKYHYGNVIASTVQKCHSFNAGL